MALNLPPAGVLPLHNLTRATRAKLAFALLTADGYTLLIERYCFSGANWIRPGSVKCRRRAVVGQQATQIADQNLSANNMALAA